MINDGTVKWEIRKITVAENSELLNGQTAAQIINETLGQVPKGVSMSVTAGTIGNAETIPLPSGYTRAQCKYAVWATDLSEDEKDGNTSHVQYLSVNQSTGLVDSRRQKYGYSSFRSVVAGYLCIAVK